MIIQNTIHCCLPQTREYDQIHLFNYFNYIMNYDQCLFSLIGYYLVAARLSWFFTILVKRQ
uniref:Uncharacterized protein n=1 Tax=Xenopus tropicalis TaxID=8364 RepID=A0A1B8XVB8_XENTR